jgi:hypothetical protein
MTAAEHPEILGGPGQGSGVGPVDAPGSCFGGGVGKPGTAMSVGQPLALSLRSPPTVDETACADDGGGAVELSAEEARNLTERIRRGLGALDAWCADVIEAHRGRVWKILGHSTWVDYCENEFQDAPRISRDSRQPLIDLLKAAGLSNRAAGAALGVSHSTVQEDLKSGRNLPLDHRKASFGLGPSLPDHRSEKQKFIERVRPHGRKMEELAGKLDKARKNQRFASARGELAKAWLPYLDELERACREMRLALEGRADDPVDLDEPDEPAALEGDDAPAGEDPPGDVLAQPADAPSGPAITSEDSEVEARSTEFGSMSVRDWCEGRSLDAGDGVR